MSKNVDTDIFNCIFRSFWTWLGFVVISCIVMYGTLEILNSLKPVIRGVFEPPMVYPIYPEPVSVEVPCGN